MAAYDALIQNREQLSRDEESSLLEKAQKGDKQAKEKLITSNISLVGYMLNVLGVGGLAEEEDLFEEGLFGLIKAIDCYKTEKQSRFASYACKAIKSYVLRFLGKENQTLYHSNITRQCAVTMKKEVTAFYNEKGRDPSFEQIAESDIKFHYSPQTIKEAWELLNEKSVSLNTPVGEDQDTLLDFTPNGIDIAEEVEAEDTRRRLITAVKEALSERDAELIIYKYGFIDGREKSGEVVGKKYHISRERVRQIEKKALPAIRACFEKKNEQKNGKFILNSPRKLKWISGSLKWRCYEKNHFKLLKKYEKL